jgi:RNA polymerase sigma factor (sigma-70 family)
MLDVELAETVGEAVGGNQEAWDALVDRFAPLVWGIARAHSLDTLDASDVSQTVWLRLAEHIGDLRDRTRIGSWLAVTTKNEAQRTHKRRQFQMPVSHERLIHLPEPNARQPEETVVASEEATALWTAFSSLGVQCRTLLRMLINDPAPSYTAVSETLGLPVGSIGPKRARCLSSLRKLLKTSSEPVST